MRSIPMFRWACGLLKVALNDPIGAVYLKGIACLHRGSIGLDQNLVVIPFLYSTQSFHETA